MEKSENENDVDKSIIETESPVSVEVENKPEKVVSIESESALRKLAFIFERMRIADYITYMQNPFRVLWLNFLAGVARGLGIAIGMTVLFAVLLYILGHMVDLPLIGKFIAKLVNIVHQELKIRPIR